MRALDTSLHRRGPKPKEGWPQLSTWPFADGYPWDEELIRNGRRALSTHGPWKPDALGEIAQKQMGWLFGVEKRPPGW